MRSARRMVGYVATDSICRAISQISSGDKARRTTSVSSPEGPLRSCQPSNGAWRSETRSAASGRLQTPEDHSPHTSVNLNKPIAGTIEAGHPRQTGDPSFIATPSQVDHHLDRVGD